MALLPFPPIRSLFVLLILLISIHCKCFAVRPVTTKSCASSLCGTISVNYPLSLYDANTSTTNSSYCGYPGLLLYCDTYGNLFFFLSSNNYTVKAISYATNTISLIDAGSSTFFPNHNVSLNPNVWLDYTDQVVNLTFFLNCSQLSTNFSYGLINQTAGSNISGKYSYVFDSDDDDFYYEYLKPCEEVITVPVMGLAVDYMNLSTTYGSTISKGFELV